MVNKVLLLGAGGQLAHAFERELQSKSLPYVAYSQKQLDICNEKALRQSIAAEDPAWVINCAAYTAVDAAEENKQAAYRVNADAVASLSEICAEKEAILIHFSTDYVYDNAVNKPLTEKDICTPKSIYGQSKLAGEQAIQASTASHLIFRISWLFAPWGNNFFKTMSKLGSKNETLRIVYDQVGTPSYAPDIARTVVGIMRKIPPHEISRASGIYNLSQTGVASWYDFARAILLPQFPQIELIPVLTSAFPRPAPRPSYSVLNLEKVRKEFDLNIRHWQPCVEDCLRTN